LHHQVTRQLSCVIQRSEIIGMLTVSTAGDRHSRVNAPAGRTDVPIADLTADPLGEDQSNRDRI
jgi:hypothetical protein